MGRRIGIALIVILGVAVLTVRHKLTNSPRNRSFAEASSSINVVLGLVRQPDCWREVVILDKCHRIASAAGHFSLMAVSGQQRARLWHKLLYASV
jgi:hypothetical protein